MITPARPADAGELLTVQRAAYLIEGERYGSFRLPPLTETLDEVRATLDAATLDAAARDAAARSADGVARDGGTVVLVARLGHRLVGSVRARVDGDTAHIGRLAVAPDLHGHGIGRRLLTAIEQALAGRVTRFELFTGADSEANLRLYRSAGYRDTGHRAIDSGPGLAYLEKRL
jgi:ribosomal protein S18 acetylase RimI-like enzyme